MGVGYDSYVSVFRTHWFDVENFATYFHSATKALSKRLLKTTRIRARRAFGVIFMIVLFWFYVSLLCHVMFLFCVLSPASVWMGGVIALYGHIVSSRSTAVWWLSYTLFFCIQAGLIYQHLGGPFGLVMALCTLTSLPWLSINTSRALYAKPISHNYCSIDNMPCVSVWLHRPGHLCN